VAPHRGEHFHALARFWTRIFAVAFAMGVGSDIPAVLLVAFIGLVISTIPYLVPPSITVWQAAARPAPSASSSRGWWC
jgi:cytochrome bd-type quinol oxidase subunit 2